MKTRVTALMAIGLVVLAFALVMGQSVPQLINYQGRLTDPSGQPLDGVSVDLTFSFYGVVSGGTAYLTVLQENVQVNKGIYHVLMGSGTITPGTEKSLADVFQKHKDVWLGIKVNTDPEMTSRSRIASSPFALGLDLRHLEKFLHTPDWDNDGHQKDFNFGGDDCNDADPTIYTGATEIPQDGIDQDCNGIDGLLGDGSTCTMPSQCQSGFCKDDYDGTGSWCAGGTQCAHDAVVYDGGTYSADCYDSGSRALCNSGNWESSSCGGASCSTCNAGACDFAPSSNQCNSNYQCSPGSGDNNYGAGGDYRCQGYCDGSGDCDYADNCQLCTLPGANSTCSGDVCIFSSCQSGYANCDGSDLNGCEVNLNDPGACSGGEYLGWICGDDYEGFLCPSHCEAGPVRISRGSKWYRIDIDECSSCCADVTIGVTLQVPSGIDYDLHLWSPCDTLLASGTNGTGVNEWIWYFVSDDCGGIDDSRTYYIEVRYYSGESCSNWTLRTYGGWGCY